jgi:hypothetical protein
MINFKNQYLTRVVNNVKNILINYFLKVYFYIFFFGFILISSLEI